MRPALLVLGYALVVAWCVPALLCRLTAGGASARLGLTAWLTAMANALVSATAAVAFLVAGAVAGWPGLAEVVCRSVAGRACVPTVYRSAAFELGLGLAAAAATVAAVMLAWRYGRGLLRAGRRTRAHAEAARITGRKLPGAGAAVVLSAPQPIAYCVPGRPATIVLTSAALEVLEPAQLTAVLAHERAHLAGRHHVLLALTRGLAGVFPGVPLFARGRDNVARLAEMCADDAAARHSGRPTLIAALLAMSMGTTVPAGALGATAAAVTARLERLAQPPHSAPSRLALAAVTVGLACVTGLVLGYAGHIVG
jgi:Zn-dependent protease with chaperone function